MQPLAFIGHRVSSLWHRGFDRHQLIRDLAELPSELADLSVAKSSGGTAGSKRPSSIQRPVSSREDRDRGRNPEAALCAAAFLGQFQI